MTNPPSETAIQPGGPTEPTVAARLADATMAELVGHGFRPDVAEIIARAVLPMYDDLMRHVFTEKPRPENFFVALLRIDGVQITVKPFVGREDLVANRSPISHVIDLAGIAWRTLQGIVDDADALGHGASRH
jgi:hypothetical protein